MIELLCGKRDERGTYVAFAGPCKHPPWTLAPDPQLQCKSQHIYAVPCMKLTTVGRVVRHKLLPAHAQAPLKKG